MKEGRIVLVTPEMARRWLMRNTGNRPLRPRKVEHFEDIIRRGEWQLTHHGVAIARDGRLLDTQHRLHAIVNTGIPCLMQLNEECAPEMFDVIDVDITPRSMSDVTGIDRREVESVRVLAQIAENDQRITTAQFRKYWTAFGAAATKLVEYCPTRTARLTSAPVRAAAILRLKEGHDESYVLLTYSAIAQRAYRDLPPVAEVLVKQLDATRKGGRASRLDQFVRSLRTFDQKNETLTRVQIKDLSADLGAARSAIRSFVYGKEEPNG